MCIDQRRHNFKHMLLINLDLSYFHLTEVMYESGQLINEIYTIGCFE